ncbi:hypothetical protein PPYR_13071 [Photinus pyralis]|nr:cilia- and flagella-associated protein 45-like [Photinus pyralis]XP_031355069.1 cilia- and flagella-associated protein 45-like [Photinus pyralis]KAB0793440.1 hypothetical protein PPYR_13060 [Photinus pyralis]KAB0793451.1 hypothetical protein PPYR_13071 [Photinus pyralis]
MPSELPTKSRKVRFDNGAHTTSECNHKIGGKYIHHKPSRASEGKEVTKVVNGTGLRELIVPCPDPLEPPVIWPISEFNRLKAQSRVWTKEDKLQLIEEAQRKNEARRIESEKRVEQLRKAQLEQRAKPGSKLFTNEADAADKNLYVLQRAFELRQEQEDEVKNANGIILAAKCLAIRKAQIVEKELLHKELTEEERRLDGMMEQERQKALKAEEERKALRHVINKRHVDGLSQQIRGNEVQRMIEVENKEEESRKINKAMIAMQREDAENLRRKKLEQAKVREELRLANENIAQFRILQKEEERIATLRVQEFMRKKAEREAARDAELAEIQAEKNRELSRLQAAQQKAMDEQSAKDELNALRTQEEVEREWREKERKAAAKRKEQLENLRIGRERQVEDIRRTQALEIQKDREEFSKIVRVQKELYEKDLEKRRRIKEAAMHHRKDLLKQVNEKECERIEQLKEKFKEGKALLLEKEVRELNIRGVIEKKIKRMRDNNVPEGVVRDIERQLKLG